MPKRHVESIHITSGVSMFTGDGFCSVDLAWTDGTSERVGQLEPTEVRTMALFWLEAAEAAEQDAALWAFARDELHVDGEAASVLLAQLRNRRHPA